MRRHKNSKPSFNKISPNLTDVPSSEPRYNHVGDSVLILLRLVGIFSAILFTSIPAFANGLRGTYFNGKNFDREVGSRIDAEVNFDWQYGSPMSGVQSDNFSVRWEGYFISPVSGELDLITRSDDGVRLYVNGELVIDDWRGHGIEENRARVSVQQGRSYEIRLEYFDGGNRARVYFEMEGLGIPQQVIPANYLSTEESGSITPPAGQPGLLAKYYHGRNFNEMRLSRIDAEINFDWVYDAPCSEVNEDEFSVRWEGYFIAPLTGEIDLITRADDAILVEFDGEEIIEDWTNGSLRENRAAVNVVAGRSYPIAVSYYENVGRARAFLEMEGSNLPRQIVTSNFLRTDSDELPSTGEVGLKGTYYRGKNFDAEVTSRVDPEVNFDWQYDSPLDGLSGDHFSVRWEGVFVAPVSGTMELITRADDGVTLEFNGREVIQDWSNGSVRENKVSVNVQEGKSYPIALYYYENVGRARVFLEMAAPGIPQQIIPAQYLRTEVGDTPDGEIPTPGSLAEACPSTDRTSPLGINLAEMSYFSSEVAFTDAFKTAMPWVSDNTQRSDWDNGWPIHLRSDGYPSKLLTHQKLTTLLRRQIGGAYPAGIYHLIYEGDGDISLSFDAKEVLSREVFRNGNTVTGGEIVFRVEPGSAGINVSLTRTNQSNPVRNIRVVPEAYRSNMEAQMFHPEFLTRLKCFGKVRFMDWNRTNSSDIVNWSERTKPGDFSQGLEGGVAYEYMVRLANDADLDLWITIPHLASNNYVQNLAQLLRSTVKPNLKIYIEYSNEVWNDQFAQYHYAIARGKALGLDFDGNDVHAGLRFYARRTAEVGRIFEDVFGSTGRYTLVLAGQSASVGKNRIIMDYYRQSMSSHPSYTQTNTFAIAPYFCENYRRDDVLRILSSNNPFQTVINECTAHLASALSKAATTIEEANDRNFEVIAYEGGQHVLARPDGHNIPGINDLLSEVNRSPQMGAFYDQYLRQWSALTPGTMFLYHMMGTYNKWGYWGLLENEAQDPFSVPKFRSAFEFIKSR